MKKNFNIFGKNEKELPTKFGTKTEKNFDKV